MENEVEIVRVRNFLEHDHMQATQTRSEYTIRNTWGDKAIDSIFLQVDDYHPNLTVTDFRKIAYPVMTNSDVVGLLSIMVENITNDEKMSDDDRDRRARKIKRLADDVRDHKTYIIWIKIPPGMELKKGETRLVYLDYETRQKDRAGIGSVRQYICDETLRLGIYPGMSFPVVWTLKMPKDCKITGRSIRVTSSLGTEKVGADAPEITYKIDKDPWRNRVLPLLDRAAGRFRSLACRFGKPPPDVGHVPGHGDQIAGRVEANKPFYHDSTSTSFIVYMKHGYGAEICYKFAAKTSTMLFPYVSFGLLTAVSTAVLFMLLAPDLTSIMPQFGVLLDRKIELAAGMASACIAIPRLIPNVMSRIRWHMWFLIPPVIVICSMIF